MGDEMQRTDYNYDHDERTDHNERTDLVHDEYHGWHDHHYSGRVVKHHDHDTLGTCDFHYGAYNDCDDAH